MEKKGLILGIDPGFTGAIALFDPVKDVILECKDLPTMINPQKRRELDLFPLCTFIDFNSPNLQFAVVEKVHSFPGMASGPQFRFAIGYGQILGILAANYIPTFLVDPAVWKPQLNLSRDKNDSIELAKKLFPESAPLLTRKKDDGRAEAMLLAYFGKRFL